MSKREHFYAVGGGWLLALAIVAGCITAYHVNADLALAQMVSSGADPAAVRCAMEAKF